MIFALFVPNFGSNFSSFIILFFTSMACHSLLYTSFSLQSIIAKVVSVKSIIVTLLLVIIEFMGKNDKTKPTNRDFYNYDRGRNLQVIVILISAFRYNKEILQMFNSTGRKDVNEMKKYSAISGIIFFAIGISFGFVFYLENLKNFRNGKLDLKDSFSIYQNSSLLLKSVIFF